MSADLLDQQWQPSDRAAVSRVGDEMVLLHLDSGTYFRLDRLGAWIWHGIKDGQTLRTLSRAIAADHEVDMARVEQDVRAFLGELREHRLVEAG